MFWKEGNNVSKGKNRMLQNEVEVSNRKQEHFEGLNIRDGRQVEEICPRILGVS